METGERTGVLAHDGKVHGPGDACQARYRAVCTGCRRTVVWCLMGRATALAIRARLWRCAACTREG